MRSNLIIVVISILLILSPICYTQITDIQSQDIRLGNLENRINIIDVKIDRNSDMIKLGFDGSTSYNDSILGRINGISSRISSIDSKIIEESNNISNINSKLVTNLSDYTTATNKIDSNNKENDVKLRGEVVQVPAKASYLFIILLCLISSIIGGIVVILINKSSHYNKD